MAAPTPTDVFCAKVAALLLICLGLAIWGWIEALARGWIQQ
jgi:hypothetical protein